MKHDSCKSNLQCWQEFGIGFVCSQPVEDAESVSMEKDDLDYCTQVQESSCTLWVDEEDYFFYDGGEFNIQNLTQEEKISDVITVISNPEDQYDWKLKYDEIKTVNEDTPVNILLCEPEDLSFAVENYGSHLLIMTKSVLQEYDLTSQISVLGDENTEGKAQLFIADVDKYGQSLSESENSSVNNDLFIKNMKALIPFSQNRVWFGVGSLDQKIAYLFDEQNEIESGTVPLSFDTSVLLHDNVYSEELFEYSLSDWTVFYDDSQSDVILSQQLDKEYIITEYFGVAFLEALRMSGFDGQLIFHVITDAQVQEVETYLNSEDNINEIQYSVQFLSETCNNSSDYKKLTITLFYVAKILLGMDNVRYTSQSRNVDESMLISETSNMLRLLTSTAVDAAPLSYDFALGITSQSISNPTTFFSNRNYYLQFDDTLMQFTDNKERHLCLDIKSPVTTPTSTQ